jgi:hypothetical protein
MTLPAETGFIEFKGWCPFNLKKNISDYMAIKELWNDTTFDIPYFSSDCTFKKCVKRKLIER